MARLLETLFNGKPLAQQVEKIRKASLDKKKRQDIRNVLIRQVSDFFETQGPFKPAKDATGYTTRFANPEAAPDALLNLEKLKDFVDEKSFQTLSSQLQTDDTGDAFVTIPPINGSSSILLFDILLWLLIFGLIVDGVVFRNSPFSFLLVL